MSKNNKHKNYSQNIVFLLGIFVSTHKYQQYMFKRKISEQNNNLSFFSHVWFDPERKKEKNHITVSFSKQPIAGPLAAAPPQLMSFPLKPNGCRKQAWLLLFVTIIAPKLNLSLCKYHTDKNAG